MYMYSQRCGIKYKQCELVKQFIVCFAPQCEGRGVTHTREQPEPLCCGYVRVQSVREEARGESLTQLHFISPSHLCASVARF